jgi:hypothetical protein
MENDQIADEILSALQQLMEAAGPEWTLAFLNAGIEQAGAGGQDQGQQMPEQPKASPGPGSFMTGLAGNA